MKRIIVSALAIILVIVAVLLFMSNKSNTEDAALTINTSSQASEVSTYQIDESSTYTHDEPAESSKNDIDIAKPTEKIIDVPAICQYPELPTGCEATATAMVLQYYGVDVSAKEFAGDWLECSNRFYKEDGRLNGPDPNEVFVGDPFSEYSYGCYAPVIAKAVNGSGSGCRATVLKNASLPELCEEYINNDKPLLIWATMGMKPSKKTAIWYLPDGSEFQWTKGEHCLVLVGYDEDYYYLNDPETGSTITYEKALVEKRYSELGKQAVYIEVRN